MKKTNTTNTSIINVTVNGMSAMDTITNVKSRLESVEKSAFNIALLVAYGVGVTIPTYMDNKGNEHGEATCEKPLKQNDYIKLVGRAESTISRWLKAFKLILEKGYFTDFQNGVYPFSFDKIITIFENEEIFKGYVFADLMDLSATTLKTMSKTLVTKEEEEENTSETLEEETQEDETLETLATKEEEEVLTTLSYDGKEYLVPKALFEKWLAENGTLKK